MVAATEDAEVPTVTVLVLGEPRVGDMGQGIRLMQGAHVAPLSQPKRPHDSTSASLSSLNSSNATLIPSSPSSSSSSSSSSSFSSSSSSSSSFSSSPLPLPLLPPSAQPHLVSLRLHNKPYALLLYDTASPTPFTALSPDLIILAFDVSRRATLTALRDRWLPLVDVAFNADERVGVMVLGLCRDRRDKLRYRDEDAVGGGDVEGRGDGGLGNGVEGAGGGGGIVTPHEALAVAQAMRCDRYAECSALTGELCGLVVEDVAKMAAAAADANANADGEGGGRMQGGCGVM
ncbi:uncharacterized protein IWZ02DRAFT_515501 [Phyllosticta citriasiana]|uniref:uncharacterized protein n=1 Tax=Phyllosticta citriasiana TaxID=595635 RepID=UPI0030FD6383